MEAVCNKHKIVILWQLVAISRHWFRQSASRDSANYHIFPVCDLSAVSPLASRDRWRLRSFQAPASLGIHLDLVTVLQPSFSVSEAGTSS
jgi:hypothetical protein